MREILEALGDADGDYNGQLRVALATLRRLPENDCAGALRTALDAAQTIESGLDGVRKQHQLAVSQFMIEIRMLHKRIDTLESAASIDMLTKLYTRQEFEARVRARQSAFCLLLVHADGIRAAEERHGRTVAEELTGAVIRRLRNATPDAVLGRWSEQGFAAMLDSDGDGSEQLAARIASSLGGSYACLKDGKTVRPPVTPRVKAIGGASGDAEERLRLAGDFFGEEASH